MQFYRQLPKQCLPSLLTALFIAPLFFSLAIGQAATLGTTNQAANLRAGPATSYAVTGTVAPGQSVNIIGKNTTGTWYQLAEGQWIAAFLVDIGVHPPTATVGAITAASAKQAANLRAGPGVTYAVTGHVVAGQPLNVVGRNANGSWLQIANGAWIAAFLVQQGSGLAAVPTRAPPATSPNGNEFVLVEKRLWNPYENGGSLDGPSVHCGQGRQLLVNVLDAQGNRLNGVAVQAQYGARETVVTGAQGKGDGVAEFVLGGGQEVKVIQDVDGRAVTSAVATGLSTNPANIPAALLISAQYCQDAASCQHFAETNSCQGHFSWSVTFQRQR